MKKNPRDLFYELIFNKIMHIDCHECKATGENRAHDVWLFLASKIENLSQHKHSHYVRV